MFDGSRVKDGGRILESVEVIERAERRKWRISALDADRIAVGRVSRWLE